MSLKNKQEIYQALLEGKKITYTILYCEYLHLDRNGDLMTDRNTWTSKDFEDASEWFLYEEPKKKKKITLYRYTYAGKSHLYFQSDWTNNKVEQEYVNGNKVVMIETK